MRTQTHKYRKRTSSGFTLLEVLIAVLVLSIGLLGLAGLQATGLRANHSAYLRSQATILASDIIESMRANMPNQIANPSYVLTMGGSPSGGSVSGDDLTNWINNIQATLPAGDGSVAMNGNTATVTIQWDDSRGEQAVQQFVVETQL